MRKELHYAPYITCEGLERDGDEQNFQRERDAWEFCTGIPMRNPTTIPSRNKARNLRTELGETLQFHRQRWLVHPTRRELPDDFESCQGSDFSIFQCKGKEGPNEWPSMRKVPSKQSEAGIRIKKYLKTYAVLKPIEGGDYLSRIGEVDLRLCQSVEML